MPTSQYRWQLPGYPPGLPEELAGKLGIPLAVARLLVNRGIKGPEEGEAFLYPGLQGLHPPGQMKGLEPARDRLREALEKGQKITVYGDYDVDGVTGTAILVSLLQGLGGTVSYYIPDRFTEGYGLNRAALEKIQGEGTGLVITVDCGISAREEVEYAGSLGLDLIITDHHAPPEELPRCLVVNPRQPGCTYPWKHLAGVGVAFKLAQLLLPREGWEGYLDLVALGTIADVVPLQGENRCLVSLGLEQLNRTGRPGLQALGEVSGYQGRELLSRQVAFSLAPRINAAGRMARAGEAVELLLTPCPRRAGELARELDRLNGERKQVQGAFFQQVVAEIQAKGLYRDRVLVAAGEGWHPGIIGITASRLAEEYYRPVVLISLEGDRGRGSARSIQGFDLFQAVQQCSHLLTRYGGHPQAAGLSLPRENLEGFQQAMNAVAQRDYPPSLWEPKISLEAELGEEDIDLELLGQLKRLEPFGYGNPSPLFQSNYLEIQEYSLVGREKKHLKLWLKGKVKVLESIFFHVQDDLNIPLDQRKVSAAFSLEEDDWGGVPRPVLHLKDLAFNDLLKTGNLAIIDCREMQKKDKYLGKLLDTGPAIIYINTLKQKERLSRLTGDRPGVYFSHQGSLEEDPGEVEHLVIYDLPLEPEKVLPLVTPGRGIKVHLLYNLQDRDSNRLLLQAVLPRRESLVEIYKALRALDKGGARGREIGLDQLLKSLRGKKGLPFTRPLVQKGLRIFQELGLLEIKPGEPHRAILLPAGDNGSLDSSKLYKEQSRRWEEVDRNMAFLLEADKESLFSFLEDFKSRRAGRSS